MGVLVEVTYEAVCERVVQQRGLRERREDVSGVGARRTVKERYNRHTAAD